MKEFWLASNREEAQRITFNMLIGKLRGMQEFNKQPTCEELLKYIEETVQEETERLNKKFPKHA